MHVLWGRGGKDGDLLPSFWYLGGRFVFLETVWVSYSHYLEAVGSILEALCAFGALFGPPPPRDERQTNRIWGPRGGVLSAVCWKSEDLVNA